MNIDPTNFVTVEKRPGGCGVMNDIFARRASQTMMMFQAQRMLPTLWQATQVTKERLDEQFVKEEFMRVNGHHQQHLLVDGATDPDLHFQHWRRLHSTLAWAESFRAYEVGHKSPLTQRFADVGLMKNSIPNVRRTATAQKIFEEHVARTEGTFSYEPPRVDESTASQ